MRMMCKLDCRGLAGRRFRLCGLLLAASLGLASAALAGTTYQATAVIYLGDGAGTLVQGPSFTGSVTLTPAPGPTLGLGAGVLQGTAILTYTVGGGAVQLGGTGAPITAGNATTVYTQAHGGATVPFQVYVVARQTTAVGNGAGSFAPGGGSNGGFGGALSIGGQDTLDTFVFLGSWQPLTATIPLGPVGSGGMATAPLTLYGSALGSIVVTGQKWTTGVVSGTSNNTLFGNPPFTTVYVAQGTNMLTPSGGGRVTLVTPYVVNVNASSPEQRVGYVKLTLVPEPGTLLLLGAGLAGLALTHRRRSRAR